MSEVPQISFRVGEVMRHEQFRSFRIIRVGENGITTTSLDGHIQRKKPYVVTFKGVRFFVYRQEGRTFYLRNITEHEYLNILERHQRSEFLATGKALPKHLEDVDRIGMPDASLRADNSDEVGTTSAVD